MQGKIILICDECLSRNYSIKRSVSSVHTRLNLKKHCSKCNKHTIHKESK